MEVDLTEPGLDSVFGQRPRRRPTEDIAVEIEPALVTGTIEDVARAVPVENAPQVRTDGRQRDELAIRVTNNPDRLAAMGGRDGPGPPADPLRHRS